MIDEWKRKGQSPGIELRDKVRDHTAGRFLQPGRPRKQRSGMSVVTQAEQNQIVPIDVFAALRRQKVEMILIFLRRNLWLELAAHPHDRFVGQVRGNNKRLASHAVVALLVIRRNAAFVAKSNERSFPRQIAADTRQFRVNRARRVPAGKGDAKLVAFRQRLAGKINNEIHSIGREIFRADNFAAHALKSRNATRRVSPDSVDDILPRARISGPAQFASRSTGENVRSARSFLSMLAPLLFARAT